MDATAVSTDRAVEPSLWNAFPHFLPIAVFPLIFAAAVYGGWWIAGPLVFFMIAGPLDLAFGMDGRNMDPRATPEHRLIWYNLSVWLWALLWPVAFVFTLWQICITGHLAPWEGALMAIILAVEGQGVFIVGHELIHRRMTWERYIGEFLLASVSYPHYSTEHFYIHHACVGTPKDVGSAPKGQSFWRYFPRELASNILCAWKAERGRMVHRQLSTWHFSNPFWRYGLETAVWYAFVWLMGGWWAVLIFMFLCLGIVFSMKISNYIQHYGLRRVRLPNGRYERVCPRHSWGTDYKFSNWMFFNMQRHPDHHVSAGRRYPLLQHHGADESPQLPGGYGSMFGLALRPKRFFETMDPLVDQWRARFYPEIENWDAYDSPVSEARPEAFDAIVEIFGAAPRLARAIEREPELLDSLKDNEFTDLELPKGFGPDPEFERIAGRGLVRVYWTHEFGVAQMKEQITELPVKDAADAAETARNWSNNKVFQIGMHTLRGNLTPTEAGVALAHIAESSIDAVLQAVVEDVADRIGMRTLRRNPAPAWTGAMEPPADAGNHHPPHAGGVAAVVLGDLASLEVAPRASLDILFLYEGGSASHHQALCRRFQEALGILTRTSLLFEPSSRSERSPAVYALDDFTQHYRTASTGDLLDLVRARCIFISGDPEIGQRFDEARRALLTHGPARDALIRKLRDTAEDEAVPECSLTACMQRGLRDVERAAGLLQLACPEEMPDSLTTDNAASVFKAGQALGTIPGEVAEQLTGAAIMWRNLHGFRKLILEDGASFESMANKARMVVAQSCDQADFDRLTVAAREAAAATESGLATVIAQTS